MSLNEANIAGFAELEVHFALEPLLFFHQRKRAILADCVRRGKFDALAAPLTSHDYEQVLAVTGWGDLRSGPTFLSEPPIEWLYCTEPQITSGWAHQLEAAHTLKRCQAVFEAVACLVPKAPRVRLKHVDAVFAEDGRVDLLVVATDENEGVHALCIEAKFGHIVTEGQLDKSASHVRQWYNPSYLTCLLIGPTLTANAASMSRVAKDSWTFVSWKHFLIAYENALPPEADSEAFRQFRSTCHARNQSEFF